jgi:hypothetical protein
MDRPPLELLGKGVPTYKYVERGFGGLQKLEKG